MNTLVTKYLYDNYKSSKLLEQYLIETDQENSTSTAESTIQSIISLIKQKDFDSAIKLISKDFPKEIVDKILPKLFLKKFMNKVLSTLNVWKEAKQLQEDSTLLNKKRHKQKKRSSANNEENGSYKPENMNELLNSLHTLQSELSPYETIVSLPTALTSQLLFVKNVERAKSIMSEIDSIAACDQQLITFIKDQLGQVLFCNFQYPQAQKLSPNDLTLEELMDFEFSRKIQKSDQVPSSLKLIIKDDKSTEISHVAIVPQISKLFILYPTSVLIYNIKSQGCPEKKENTSNSNIISIVYPKCISTRSKAKGILFENTENLEIAHQTANNRKVTTTNNDFTNTSNIKFTLELKIEDLVFSSKPLTTMKFSSDNSRILLYGNNEGKVIHFKLYKKRDRLIKSLNTIKLNEVDTHISCACFTQNCESIMVFTYTTKELLLFWISGFCAKRINFCVVNDIIILCDLSILQTPTSNSLIIVPNRDLYNIASLDEFEANNLNSKITVIDSILSFDYCRSLDSNIRSTTTKIIINYSLHSPAISLYNLDNPQKCIRKFFGHRQSVLSSKCRFSNDQKFILCPSEDMIICIWRMDNSLPVYMIKEDRISNLVFWPYVNLMVSASNESVYVYSINEEIELEETNEYKLGKSKIKLKRSYGITNPFKVFFKQNDEEEPEALSNIDEMSRIASNSYSSQNDEDLFL